MSKYGPEKAQYLDAFHAWLFSFYFHVYIFGCLRLTKWLQYIFSVFLKFGAYYIRGQWGEFIKQCYLMHLCTFVFHHKICVFIIFISFFDEVSNFRNRILTKQKRELIVSNCQWNCMFCFNECFKDLIIAVLIVFPCETEYLQQ